MNKKQLEKSYRNVLIYVTKRCNLQCPRCFLSDLSKEIRNYSMTKEQFKKIIQRLNEQGIDVEWMHFTGGEPTLWPHLKWAIRYAKDNCNIKNVRIVTNAVDRNAEDYGDADTVHISHYGALNRIDILRLKRQLGRKRCKVQYTVHLPWPFPKNSPNPLPASCGCVNLAFVGDKVYQCGLAAARETGNWVDIGESFYEIFLERNPHLQDLCKTCISNRKNKMLNMTGLTAEFGIWDSSVGGFLGLNSKVVWLRKIYNYLI